jgi:hypothetical protein
MLKMAIILVEMCIREVPKCGSMKLPPELWKRIRSEAFKQSGVIS